MIIRASMALCGYTSAVTDGELECAAAAYSRHTND